MLCRRERERDDSVLAKENKTILKLLAIHRNERERSGGDIENFERFLKLPPLLQFSPFSKKSQENTSQGLSRLFFKFLNDFKGKCVCIYYSSILVSHFRNARAKKNV